MSGPRITILDAKWLDPECHQGCQSLIHKHRIEQLERELDEAKEQLENALNPIHSCGDGCQRPACQLRREAKDAERSGYERGVRDSAASLTATPLSYRSGKKRMREAFEASILSLLDKKEDSK